MNNYVAVFGTDVYFLNTELQLVKLDVKQIGSGVTQADRVEDVFSELGKIEDFLIDEKGNITFLTPEGKIKEWIKDPNAAINAKHQGKLSDKSLDCTKHTQNVSYWNKLAKIGNCILAAGSSMEKKGTSVLCLVEGWGMACPPLIVPCSWSRLWMIIGDHPILRMLEIPSKKYPGVTFVLAAEHYNNAHLLALTLGNKKRMVHVAQKQVSSSSSKFKLQEELITQVAASIPCVSSPSTSSSASTTQTPM